MFNLFPITDKNVLYSSQTFPLLNDSVIIEYPIFIFPFDYSDDILIDQLKYFEKKYDTINKNKQEFDSEFLQMKQSIERKDVFPDFEKEFNYLRNLSFGDINELRRRFQLWKTEYEQKINEKK